MVTDLLEGAEPQGALACAQGDSQKFEEWAQQQTASSEDVNWGCGFRNPLPAWVLGSMHPEWGGGLPPPRRMGLECGCRKPPISPPCLPTTAGRAGLYLAALFRAGASCWIAAQTLTAGVGSAKCSFRFLPSSQAEDEVRSDTPSPLSGDIPLACSGGGGAPPSGSVNLARVESIPPAT